LRERTELVIARLPSSLNFPTDDLPEDQIAGPACWPKRFPPAPWRSNIPANT
jgi:hypothetical protein